MASIPSLKGATISAIFLSSSFASTPSPLIFGQGYPLPSSVHTCLPTPVILDPSPPASLLLPLPLPFLRRSGHQLSTTEHTLALIVAARLHTYRTLEGGRNRVL